MTKKVGRKKVYTDKKKISVDFESHTLDKVDYLKSAYSCSSRSQVFSMCVDAFYNAYLRKLEQS